LKVEKAGAGDDGREPRYTAYYAEHDQRSNDAQTTQDNVKKGDDLAMLSTKPSALRLRLRTGTNESFPGDWGTGPPFQGML
jgi:hypothetical protein